MKNRFLYLLTALLLSITSFAQVTNKIQADSVKFYQVNGHTSEFILENSTKGNTGGFLQNVYNGRTKFAYALDSAWKTGNNLYFRRGASTLSFAFRDGFDSIHISNDSLYEYKDGISFFKGLIGGSVGAGKLNISDTGTMLSPYLRKIDTTNKWLAWVNATATGALGFTGGPITSHGGTLSLNWQGTSSEMVRADGSRTTFSTAVTGVTNPLYAPTTHSHLSTDITDFTTAGRNLLSGGTGISYNPSTGVIAWTGSASGITSFNGLTGTTQTLTTGTSGSDFGISSVGTAHTFNLPKAALNVTGKLDSADWRRFDSSYQIIKSGVTGAPSLTQYRLAIGNASNQLSTAPAITGSRVLVSDANGVPTHSTVTTTTLGYLDATSSVQTQLNSKEATFTETTQEFTGATSMSITLSNTPKSGKAEMYYLNGIVIVSSNISRTGTTVTLSGFTRESSDVITAKYSY